MLTGEIKDREFSMLNFSRFIACFGCFLFRIEESQIYLIPMSRKSCSPFARWLVERYASVSASIIGLSATIERILRARTFSKVILPIVQRVSIYMVYLIVGTMEYYRTHLNQNTIIVAPDSVEGSGAFVICSMPIPLIQPIKIILIYNGILALSKWDKAVRFVERLSHSVAFNTLFHWSSAKGLMRFNRYFNLQAGFCK